MSTIALQATLQRRFLAKQAHLKCYCCVSKWKFKIKPDLPNDLFVTFPGKSIAMNFPVLSLSNSLCFPSDFVST